MDPETLMLLLGMSSPPDPRLTNPVAALSGGQPPFSALPIQPTPSFATPPPAPQPIPAPAPVGSPYQEAKPGMTPASSLGAALEPQDTQANPWSSGGVADPNAQTSAAAGAAPGNALLNTLKGVKMPEAPVAQKVSTPHAPQLAKIQGGALFDLLASLGIGPQQALPGLKLPSTLGQALGGR